MSSELNKSTPQGTRVTDANGQAAILLVESLIHGLIARSVLTVAEAVEIIDEAAIVSREIAADARDGQAGTLAPDVVLDAISRSLGRDLPRG